ncbi:MAG: hypothetical protein GX493_12175 [Firmicutes bacterium]|nr:hypothetical protein [Bacillota bacterium]
MTIRPWVICAERRGVEFRVWGDRLIIRAPEGFLLPRRRAMLAKRKPEIIRFLIDRGAAEILRQVIHPVGSRGPEHDNPLDYRFDPATGRWIVDPGWWRRLPGRPKYPLGG